MVAVSPACFPCMSNPAEEHMLILRIRSDILRGRDIEGSICWISFRGSKLPKGERERANRFASCCIHGRFDLGNFFQAT